MYQWSNLLGTRHGEVSFIKDDISMQISHLEAIEEILRNKNKEYINLNKTEFNKIDKIEKSHSKNLYFENVGTVIYSERDTHAGDITSIPAPPRVAVKKIMG